ncbi:MAG: response regulator transcription factor [bacterium]|nr:response regulator transcription factor [bacterium]
MTARPTPEEDCDPTMLPIIVLSNDAETRRDLAAALALAGFGAVAAEKRPATCATLPDRVRHGGALVVLDLGPEPGTALDWCRAARRELPGLLLCAVARGPEAALEVTALEQGADAVVSWPPDPRRLSAQLRAMQRPLRAAMPAGDLALDAAHRHAVVDGRHLALTDGEFELLAVLHRRRGSVVTRDELSLELHGRTCAAGDRSLDLRVTRLRRKLGDDSRAPRWIRAVRGEGYLLLPPSA